MSVKTILTDPNPILRNRSEIIEEITPYIMALAVDLEDTLESTENGIGLASPQIGINKRIIVWKHITGKVNIIINPMIESRRGEIIMNEACLSVPGVTGGVKRSYEIWLRGVGKSGNRIKMKYKGVTACMFQHEIDHLEGILFTDKLSPK